jgi:hypothetical protein
MEQDVCAASPIRIYAGVIVFFNPRWVAEIKIGARILEIIRHCQWRRCRQRVVIISAICATYHIPVRWWVQHCDPDSYSVVFSDFVVWHHNRESGEHIFSCNKQPKFFEEAMFGDARIQRNKSVAFTYLDVERIEHRDGTALWQKKR